MWLPHLLYIKTDYLSENVACVGADEMVGEKITSASKEVPPVLTLIADVWIIPVQKWEMNKINFDELWLSMGTMKQYINHPKLDDEYPVRMVNHYCNPSFSPNPLGIVGRGSQPRCSDGMIHITMYAQHSNSKNNANKKES